MPRAAPTGKRCPGQRDRLSDQLRLHPREGDDEVRHEAEEVVHGVRIRVARGEQLVRGDDQGRGVHRALRVGERDGHPRSRLAAEEADRLQHLLHEGRLPRGGQREPVHLADPREGRFGPGVVVLGPRGLRAEGVGVDPDAVPRLQERHPVRSQQRRLLDVVHLVLQHAGRVPDDVVDRVPERIVRVLAPGEHRDLRVQQAVGTGDGVVHRDPPLNRHGAIPKRGLRLREPAGSRRASPPRGSRTSRGRTCRAPGTGPGSHGPCAAPRRAGPCAGR